MRRLSWVWLGLSSSLSWACGDDGKLDGPTVGGDPKTPSVEGCGSASVSTAVSTGFAEPIAVAGSACEAVVTEEAVLSDEEGGAKHVDECSKVTYSTNPPSSGPHYPIWAAFDMYDRPVARGFWMHSLEHGGVAFLYNCEDCDAEIEAAKELIAELPEDPQCVGQPTRHRILMTPDPLLDVPWAAAAWGFTLRSQCFEPEAFRAFATEHYGRAREETCFAGKSF